MSIPLVSVIVPSFNRAWCVCRTIDTALAQSHPRVEVVVVDDGSQDNTQEVIAQRYAGDPRVRYIHQQNTGVAGARNTGLTAAQGDFLAFLDSDDLWLPWKLELQLRVMQTWPDVGMVWSDMEAIDADGRTIAARYLKTFYTSYKWWTRDDLFCRHTRVSGIAADLVPAVGDAAVCAGNLYSPMLMGNLVHTSTVMLRRERFEKVGLFDPTLKPTGEDYEYHLRTTREGLVGFVDAPAIKYQRGFADRLTRDEYEIYFARNFLKVIEPRLTADRDRIWLPEWMQQRVLAESYAWVGSAELSLGRRKEAQQHLARSLRHNWKQCRTAALWGLSSLPEWADRGLRTVLRTILGRRKAEA